MKQVRVLVHLVVIAVVTTAFSGPKPSPTFRIVGSLSSGTQYLPKAYVAGFTRWIIERQESLCKVDATPELSDVVQVRPTLNFIVRGGTPVYFLSGIQTRSSTNDLVGSYELAQQWLPFNMAVEPNMRMAVFCGDGDGTDDRLALIDAQAVQDALEKLGVTISTAETLNEGFHVITMPMMNGEWLMVPNLNGQGNLLTVLASAEPELRELVNMDPSLLEITATSHLQTTLGDVTL